MAKVVSAAVSLENQQNNDQVTRLILLGMTGGGMYHYSISSFLNARRKERNPVILNSKDSVRFDRISKGKSGQSWNHGFRRIPKDSLSFLDSIEF